MGTEPEDGSNGGSGREKSGRFAPGNKFGQGNPHVRRLTEYRAAVREAIQPKYVATVLKKMVKLAVEEGDVAAARVLLERTLGKPKDAPDEAFATFELPAISTASDCVTAAGKVLAAVAAGEVGMAEAGQITGMIEVLRRGIETASLEARVAALEESDGQVPDTGGDPTHQRYA